MSAIFSIATLNDGTAVINSATSGAGVIVGTGIGAINADLVLICQCTAVAGAGSFTITVDGLPYDSATWRQVGAFGTRA